MAGRGQGGPFEPVAFYFELKIMKRKLITQLGFTMVEILLVASLMGVVGVSLYHAFANGLKIWERSRQFTVQEDIDIFWDKIGRDLNNTLNFSRIGFQGRENFVSFAAPVQTSADTRSGLEAGSLTDQVGRVEYFFDPGKKTIFRRQANYSQALEQKSGMEVPLLSRVKAVKFLYYYIDTAGQVEKTTTTSNIPVAVEMNIELENDSMQSKMTKLVSIPVGI